MSLIVLLILPSVTVTSIRVSSDSSVKGLGLLKSHVIEGVPYVAQNDFGCAYASLAMIFGYYGKNTSMMKNYYYCGAGYSFAYPRKPESIVTPPIVRPPYCFILRTSSTFSQGKEDWEFMSSLNGVESINYWPPKIVFNHFKAWNDYWTKIKNLVTQDNPVLTSVDPLAWPVYQEAMNMTKTPLLARAGHAIVIVGFNEKNRTICVQDPCAGSEKYYNPDRIGYQWIKLDVFKRALRRSFWDFRQNSYEMWAVKNITETPSFDTAFEMAHSKNIEKLKGNKSAYDSDFINPQFEQFGIKALKTLRDDYKSLKLYLLYPFLKMSAKKTGPGKNACPFTKDSGYHTYEAAIQNNMSIFLQEIKTELTDEKLKQICDYESALFKNTSVKFYELADNVSKLQDSLYEKSMLNFFLEVKTIKDTIVSVLDEIISIQQAIIDGPPEEI